MELAERNGQLLTMRWWQTNLYVMILACLGPQLPKASYCWLVQRKTLSCCPDWSTSLHAEEMGYYFVLCPGHGNVCGQVQWITRCCLEQKKVAVAVCWHSLNTMTPWSSHPCWHTEIIEIGHCLLGQAFPKSKNWLTLTQSLCPPSSAIENSFRFINFRFCSSCSSTFRRVNSIASMTLGPPSSSTIL